MAANDSCCGQRHQAARFRYATQAGITCRRWTFPTLRRSGVITHREGSRRRRAHVPPWRHDRRREYRKVIELWQKAYEEVGNATEQAFDKFSPIWMMMGSGARGNIQQIRQLAGMRGLMADPTGRIIDLPIQANFTGAHRARVLHLDPRHSQRPRGHRPSHRRLGLLTRRLVDVART